MKCHNCGKEFDESISMLICRFCGFDNSLYDKDKRTVGVFKKEKEEDAAFVEKHKDSTDQQEKNTFKWLQPGMVVNGRYEIIETIGAGGFGITYKARDNCNDTLVALKEYFQNDISNRVVGTSEVLLVAKAYREMFEYGKQRLLHEARVVAKFQSPHIVRVMDYFEANNTSYMVMEYLPDPDLRQCIEQRKQLDTETIISIGVKLCEALEEIHASGVIHRDIAPDNVIVSKRDTIKLIDFGSARLSKNDIDNRLIAFKPGYAPPEQYEAIDSKHDMQREWTDVYAVGATLYALFTGRIPIESTDRKIDVNNSDRNDPLCYPSEINHNIPEYIDNAIMKAMAINIHERFQNVTELKQALLKERKVIKIEDARRIKRRNRKIGIIGGFLTAAIVLGIGGKIYTDKRASFEFLDEAKVSIWYPVGENEIDDTAKSKMIESIVEELKASDKFANVSIDIKEIDREEYTSALTDAYVEGSLPTIFEYSSELEYSLEDLSDALPSEKECNMVGSFKRGTISTGINVPVIYYNYMLLSNPDEETTLSFGSIEEIVEYCSAGSISVNPKNEEQFRHIFKDYDTYRDDMVSGIDAFLDGKALVYFSDTSEMNTIIGNYAAQYDTAHINTDSLPCTFTDAWAMKECDDAEERAGKEIIAYFLSNTSQTSGYIENGMEGIPLEKNTVNDFITNKSTYSDFQLDYRKYIIEDQDTLL